MSQELRVMALACLMGMAAGVRLAKEPQAYYWSGRNGGSLRTGSAEFTVPSDISNGPTWSFHEDPPAYVRAITNVVPTQGRLQMLNQYKNFKGLSRATPLIDDKKNIYYATVTYGNIYKFSPDGKQLWKYHSGGQIPDVPTLYNGRLFASTTARGGEVIALDMETGELLWRSKGNSNSAGDQGIAKDTFSVAAGEDMVIAGTMGIIADHENHRLVARHASNGSLAWRFDPSGKLYNSMVAIKDGSVVFSTSGGKVYRLDVKTGKPIWETPKPNGLDFTSSTGGASIGPNGVVYNTWNELYVKWNENGTQINTTDTKCVEGPEHFLDPIGCQTGRVGAYRFTDGKRLWAYNTGFYDANNPAAVGRLSNGKLAVVIGVGGNPNVPYYRGISDGRGPEHKGRIIALDALTGRRLWKYELPPWAGSAMGDSRRPDICMPDAFGNAVIAGDGTVYVGFQSGKLYGLKDSNDDGEISEEEVSTWNTGAAFQAGAALAPGMLVAAPCDGLHVWKL